MQLCIPPCDVMAPADLATEAGFFAANGYLIVRGAVPNGLVERLAQWTRTRFWDLHGALVCHRLQDEWKTNEDVRRLATLPALLDKLQQLYGRAPIPFQTLNFPVGTQQRTHSDVIHFHCYPQRFMAGVWVALERVDESNGAVHYYPGSHRLPVLECHDVGIDGAWGLSNPSETYGPNHYQRYEQAIAELVRVAGLEKQVVSLEPGDALIWAANLLHGGEPIARNGATRFSQVTHYYFEGGRFYTPLLSDLPNGYVHFRDEIVDVRTGRMVEQKRKSLLGHGASRVRSFLRTVRGRVARATKALRGAGPG